jgi:hypothetical protein
MGLTEIEFYSAPWHGLAATAKIKHSKERDEGGTEKKFSVPLVSNPSISKNLLPL